MKNINPKAVFFIVGCGLLFGGIFGTVAAACIASGTACILSALIP